MAIKAYPQPVEQVPDSSGTNVEMVPVLLHLPVADAEGLAAAKVERGDSALYVADCRPVATAIADALVAAGLGGS